MGIETKTLPPELYEQIYDIFKPNLQN